jgi:uncharacterized metal-binding protein YceD (DUF177 family)
MSKKAPDPAMAAPLPWQAPLRRRDLPARAPRVFALAPKAEERAALAKALGLIALKELRFEGEIAPLGAQDYELTGTLHAKAVQACVRTLAPVPSQLHEKVHRHYVAGTFWPEASEVEMPPDVDTEPLPEVLDLAAVAIEALMLALPAYPMAEAAEAPPEAEGAATSEGPTRRPFAGLADLLGQEPAKGQGAKD